MAHLTCTTPVCRGTPRRERNGLPEQLFDRAPLQVVFGRDKTRRLSGRVHAGRSADSMDVIFGTVRQIVIHHMSNIGHIDATRGNIRRDENAECPALKSF